MVGNVFERAVALVAGQRGLLHVLVVRVAVGREDVEPAVIVVVEQHRAPAGVLAHEDRQAGLVGVVLEAPRPLHLEGVVTQVRRINIDQAVAVDVARDRPHGRYALAVLAEGHAQLQGLIHKGALAGVHVEAVLHGVVGDIDVQKTVVVEVGRGGAHGAAVLLVEAGFLGYVGEGAVAVVAVEGTRLAAVA